MGIKKKDIDREYRDFIESWFPKIVERGTLILLSIKDKTEIKEDDLEVLKFFYRSYHNGELSCFMQEVSQPQEQNVTQNNLFTVNPTETSNDVTVYPDTIEVGMGIEDMPVETKKGKK